MGNSKQCIESGSCPAYQSCIAAEKAIDRYASDADDQLPSRWELQRKAIVGMRKIVIEELAAQIDCGFSKSSEEPTPTEDNVSNMPQPTFRPCPLPLGMAENNVFGPPEEMNATAMHIAQQQQGSQLGFRQS